MGYFIKILPLQCVFKCWRYIWGRETNNLLTDNEPFTWISVIQVTSLELFEQLFFCKYTKYVIDFNLNRNLIKMYKKLRLSIVPHRNSPMTCECNCRFFRSISEKNHNSFSNVEYESQSTHTIFYIR